MTEEEKIKVENEAMRVAIDLWQTDLLGRLGDTIRRDTLAQFRPTIEGMVTAAKHLALATPDKRLRAELERYVQMGERQLKNPQLGHPYPDKKELREARVFQETEQALYREAMRHDQTKHDLMKELVRVSKENEELKARLKAAESASKGYEGERDQTEQLAREAGYTGESNATPGQWFAQQLAKVNREADECMKAIDTITMEFVLAVEKASRAAPLNRREALTYIAVLGAERDKAVQDSQAALISRHREGCPHYRNKVQNIFLLSDEDSYDCCTCLQNFVSDYRYNQLLVVCALVANLLLTAGDASVAGMHENWKAQKNRVLKMYESLGFLRERTERKIHPKDEKDILG